MLRANSPTVQTNTTPSRLRCAHILCAVAVCVILVSSPALSQRDEFVNLVNARLIPNLAAELRAVSSDPLSETGSMNITMQDICHFAPTHTAEQELESLATKETTLRRACLFPIVAGELMKRRMLILSGRYVSLPRDWSLYTLEARQFNENMFAPSSPQQLIFEYIVLCHALRYSTTDLTSYLLSNQRDFEPALFTNDLFRLNAAVSGSSWTVRLRSSTSYLRSKDVPDYVVRWRELFSGTMYLAVAPYQHKLESLAKGVMSPEHKTLRSRNLSEIYAASRSLLSLGNGQDNAAEDILRFVQRQRCSNPNTQLILESYKTFIHGGGSIKDKLALPDQLAALSAAAELSELEGIHSDGAPLRANVSTALDGLADMSELARASDREVGMTVSVLETYLETDSISPY